MSPSFTLHFIVASNEILRPACLAAGVLACSYTIAAAAAAAVN